jgi:hypothetical protein
MIIPLPREYIVITIEPPHFWNAANDVDDYILLHDEAPAI